MPGQVVAHRICIVHVAGESIENFVHVHSGRRLVSRLEFLGDSSGIDFDKVKLHRGWRREYDAHFLLRIRAKQSMGNIGARGKVKNQGELGFSRKIVLALQGSHRRETPDRTL
jgi:hypothetical protein